MIQAEVLLYFFLYYKKYSEKMSCDAGSGSYIVI